MLRIATKEDYLIVKELAEELMKESVYAPLFAEHIFSEEMFSWYSNPDTLNEKICFLFSTEEDKDVGLGAFDIVPWLYNDVPKKIARLSYPYIKPSFRNRGLGKEMKQAFEYWGKQAGADYYSVSHPGEGYKEYETIYMKEVI